MDGEKSLRTRVKDNVGYGDLRMVSYYGYCCLYIGANQPTGEESVELPRS